MKNYSFFMEKRKKRRRKKKRALFMTKNMEW
jgi:hypothetical protein